jgi:hypothetical protein
MEPRPRVFRRTRKFEGRSIDSHFASSVELLKVDRGLLCRGCGKWRAWKDIYFVYELDGAIVRRAHCFVCGNQLREDYL